nr:MAG TPA: hypothetical protein [Caudoviricetes sp.]
MRRNKRENDHGKLKRPPWQPPSSLQSVFCVVVNLSHDVFVITCTIKNSHGDPSHFACIKQFTHNIRRFHAPIGLLQLGILQIRGYYAVQYEIRISIPLRSFGFEHHRCRRFLYRDDADGGFHVILFFLCRCYGFFHFDQFFNTYSHSHTSLFYCFNKIRILRSESKGEFLLDHFPLLEIHQSKLIKEYIINGHAFLLSIYGIRIIQQPHKRSSRIMAIFPLLQIGVNVAVNDRLDRQCTRTGEGYDFGVFGIANQHVLAVCRYLTFKGFNFKEKFTIPPYFSVGTIPATTASVFHIFCSSSHYSCLLHYITNTIFRSSMALTGFTLPASTTLVPVLY